jgi:hypothetical protein
MSDRVSWAADAELVTLLRRYYQGEAGLWPAIMSRVHETLRAREAPVAPRHVRFRRTDAGYDVIVEGAEDYLV